MEVRKLSLLNETRNVSIETKRIYDGWNIYCKAPLDFAENLSKSDVSEKRKLFIYLVFFLSMFPFTNIHYSPDRMLRGRLTLILFSTISTRFTDTRFLDIRRVITAESRGDFAHGQKPDSNRKDLVSVRKSLACELRALQTFYKIDFMKVMLC